MIKKSSIRSLKPYMRLIPQGDNVYAGLVNPPGAILKKIGFSDQLADGEMVLPAPVGRASDYNANGKEDIHKDQPMEMAYRTVEWHWTEYHGRERVEQTDFRDVSYKRYPRTHIPAPALELTLFTNSNGERVVMSPLVSNWRSNEAELMHAVNLLLDIFGECSFFNEAREQIVTAPTRRLNWKILPPGEHPFPALRKELDDVLKSVKAGNRSFVDHRLERINSFKPDFTAIGQGGFSGYVVFGFPKKDIYVLESVLYGNATYVLGDDWEKLSQLTKAEILSDKLHKDRIVHLRNWFEKTRRLLT